jgi:hypothetical protein
MQRVNEALAALGDDTLNGMKLLSEVLKHPDTPLDVKIQCAGLLTKHESLTQAEHSYVVHMPPTLPGETQEQKLAVWWALHSGVENDDPEWTAACKRVLELAVTKQKPETLSSYDQIISH